jgi:N-methylhydantoinase B/oxoprolinase/acetone carboxylase alpha subunit
MSNTRNTPVEAIEHELPLRIRQYRLRHDSAGEGQYPGGEGLVREYEMLCEAEVTVLSERRRERPWGVRGGGPGGAGRNVVVWNDGRVEEVGSKVRLRLSPGDRLRIETPGGGGYGPARPEP